jgi:hypothetical protein
VFPLVVRSNGRTGCRKHAGYQILAPNVYNAVMCQVGACAGVAVGRSAAPLLEETPTARGMLAQEAGNVQFFI